MGMDTHIVGFKPPDEHWERMKRIWDSCNEADVTIPREVYDYFEGKAPDKNGVEVQLPTNPWGNDYQTGLELHVEDIPEHVKIIRFYNSW